MNVVFTCGGTAGHINPAIAVANIWKERHPEGKVLFIGGDDMEMELVPKAGYELVGFPSASFCRGLNMRAFRHNARAAGLITRAISKCKRVLQDFQADVVIGTGGYASFPALYRPRPAAFLPEKKERNRLPEAVPLLRPGSEAVFPPSEVLYFSWKQEGLPHGSPLLLP